MKTVLIDMSIGYDDKLIASISNIKFLGIVIDSILSWKIHIEQIILTLSVAWYAIRSVKPYMSQENTQDGLLFLFEIQIHILGDLFI
jgi:hypothetical protein